MNLVQAEQYRQACRAAGSTSDGCTFAPEIGTPCCEMHDYLRRFKPDGVTPLQADNLLFLCILSKGQGVKKPLHFIVACFYWLAVRGAYLLGFFK